MSSMLESSTREQDRKVRAVVDIRVAEIASVENDRRIEQAPSLVGRRSG